MCPTGLMRNKIVATAASGVIVTVVSGLILSAIPKTRDLSLQLGSWAWSVASWIYDTLRSSHSMPGWTILVAGLLALIGLSVMFLLLKAIHLGGKEHLYQHYTEDTIDGLKWRWTWVGNEISNIWCFCLSCDAQLVYAEGFGETRFICERCPPEGPFVQDELEGRIIAIERRGDRRYAVAAAKREIFRRIRTGAHRDRH